VACWRQQIELTDTKYEEKLLREKKRNKNVRNKKMWKKKAPETDQFCFPWQEWERELKGLR